MNDKEMGKVFEPKINNPSDYVLNQIEDSLSKGVSQRLEKNVDVPLSKVPPQVNADYGIHVGILARQLNVDPQKLTESLKGVAAALNDNPLISKIEQIGPYINILLEPSNFTKKVVEQVLTQKKDYGKENIGKGRVVVIDMSAPNIAKRMNYGHLRSTVIGDALANIYRSEGYDVIRDNHIGDWGTQFGKLIVAIKKWGNEEELLGAKDPIGVLQNLYVKFHDEVKTQAEVVREDIKKQMGEKGIDKFPEIKKEMDAVGKEIMERKKIGKDELNKETILEDALDKVVVTDLEKNAREWFLKLEKGDPEANRLWKICIDLSMKEFNEIYKTLGVDFEYTLGESFYQDKLDEVINEVKESGESSVSNGALVVDLKDKDLGVSIVQKSDGASVYMTRDLATAIYREQEMHADKLIYVVGEDQKLYFLQLFEILKRLNHKIGASAEHVYFGMVTLPEGKMSTRQGRVILLKDVINEGLIKAEKILLEKNPELYKNEELRKKIVRQIAIGALKWNDLGQDHKRSIVFTWDKALNFEGYSAPYVQYTVVRANSILSSGSKLVDSVSENKGTEKLYTDKLEKELAKILAEYPKAIKEAISTNNPSRIAMYVYELAKQFNSFYTNLPVLKAEDKNIVKSRLKLTLATSQVITNALGLLGIEVPEKM